MTALAEYEKMSRKDITNRIAQLDTIEKMMEKAIDLQHEADEKFRDYMLREIPKRTASAAQRKADREADKVDRAWNGFVYALPHRLWQEYAVADATTSFKMLHDDLCRAHKDLNRALTTSRIGEANA